MQSPWCDVLLSGDQKLTKASHNHRRALAAAAATARIRARLGGDPHAEFLLPSLSIIDRLRGRPWKASRPEAQAALCRSHYFDDTLKRFLSASETGQIVLLEGRYDTRPWRFSEALKGRKMFARSDKDYPGRITVRPDIALSSALRAAGCKATERTLFLWEGGSMLNSRAEVKATLSAIRSMSGAGSMLVLDCWSLSHLQSRARLLGQPVRFAIHPEDLSGLLARMGFEVIDIADAEELRRRFPSPGLQASSPCFVVTARLNAL